MTKKKMNKVGLLFPAKYKAVEDDFSYAKYIEDVNAFRDKMLEGYFEDYVDIDIFGDEKEEMLDNSSPNFNSKFYQMIKKTGDLDHQVYEEEIEKLHHEFVARILAGEDLNTVDRDISTKMHNLATKNNDGTYKITEVGSKTK